MAARSRSAIRTECRAHGWSRMPSWKAAGARCGMRWSPCVSAAAWERPHCSRFSDGKAKRGMKPILFALVALTTALLASPAFGEEGPVVEAPAGKLRGEASGEIRVFRGIPYAKPPVGELRWRPPVELPRWPGVREATRFGAA